MSYIVYTKPSFNESLDSLERSARQRVDSVIKKKLMVYPYRGAGNKGHLKGKYNGLRRIWIGRSGYRIIFSICEECRRLGFDKYLNCADCSKIPKNTVMLFDVTPRPKSYK